MSDFDKIFKQFKREVERERIIKEIKKREFYEKKFIFFSIISSFFLQCISILINFIVASGIMRNFSIPISVFFVYIPLIWLSTIIPSIGGLGVREFSYVFFFKSYMGKENAFALSLIFLLSIFIQAIIGSIIFLIGNSTAAVRKGS